MLRCCGAVPQVAVFRPGTYAVSGVRCTYTLDGGVAAGETLDAGQLLFKVDAV